MSAENYVYMKEVDWSLFNYGLNIPIQHQVKFKQIAGRFIERGIAILRMRFEDASVAVSIIRNIVKQSVTV